MNGTLADSNIILDILLDDPNWGDRSEAILDEYAQRGLLCINPIVYSEISIGFEEIEDLESAFLKAGLQMLEIPREALFLAAKAFLKCTKRRGSKNRPLPDFYIGAHAAVLGIGLITRDVSRYRSYFPSVELICP